MGYPDSFFVWMEPQKKARAVGTAPPWSCIRGYMSKNQFQIQKTVICDALLYKLLIYQS